MKIGVTVRFQNSYFSGSVPQVACALARALAAAGNSVTLLYPKSESDWFIDVSSMKTLLPNRKAWNADEHYDTIIEVVWFLPPEDRSKFTKQSVLFVHHPPIFHDMESSVYPWNPTQRNFKNLTSIVTYDHYSEQDYRYLEFLSGVPVNKIPYLWDSDPLDAYVRENNIPSWKESARHIESIVPPETPKSLAWCARIVESNFSNTSHCVIPLNIVTQIRVSGDPIRFSVHNGENLAKSEFFNGNIVRNLLLPDISGNIVPRVRLPDLRKEKTLFIGHQRFRPIKSYLLDAMYLGIPMIHNCERIRDLGAPYFYNMNQISEALVAWKQLRDDSATGKGFFSDDAAVQRTLALNRQFSPTANAKRVFDAFRPKDTIRVSDTTWIPPSVVKPVAKDTTTLRIAFCEMWADFQPNDNFFMYLLTWMGLSKNIRVVVDMETPNLVIFGPYSQNLEQKYPGVPKVFFTGENQPPHTNPDIFLNLGYCYDTNSKYIRLPLWVLEINWFGGNPDTMVNPRPVPLADCLRVSPTKKTKFCAFVATNPSNPNRNAAFHILNQWQPVDSGGRLFCNLPSGPIPAGLGGGGGELAKIEFYKQYKYVITFENASSPGYTTEKLFHAKVAGCIPIYWGDPFVDRDFNSDGFLNANQVSNAKDLLELVQKAEADEERTKKMMAVPALSEFKRRWCERTMEEIGKRIFKTVLNADIEKLNWKTAESFMASQAAPVIQKQASPKLAIREIQSQRVFVTAANTKYAEAAVNCLASLRDYERDIPKIVYIWPDVTPEQQAALRNFGATELRVFPTQAGPWADFWDPQHFAWKLWLHMDVLNRAEPNTSFLYMDAGTVFACAFPAVWKHIEEDDIFLHDDEEQQNERWCHPTFCERLAVTDTEKKTNQIWAGGIGFRSGSKYTDSVHKQAIAIAEQFRDVIVGEKWSPYSSTCMGHRHDQSILSLLTTRAGCPRQPLASYYCDRSMRTAKQWSTPFYVHRGNFREFLPFSDGIGEAYVINLDRRQDRRERFKASNKQIKSRTYVWKATDGRTLELDSTLVHCFRNNDFGWKKAVMGCALSHLGLWEKLANDKLAKSYLIMEDDVVFQERWMIQWLQGASSIPKDADVIYLGGILPPNKAMFPSIVEPVNKHFARVQKNQLFGGGAARRYFHFCNYAYVLTQQGARKLCTLIKEKGIFTSGDHMIVNHGDELLNIYFTTPLMATCFQEDDPVYQKSEFNNFSRIDGFDSDLWNNNDRFTKEEVMKCLTADIQTGTIRVEGNTTPALTVSAPPTTTIPQVMPTSPSVTTTVPKSQQEENIAMWNRFLRHVALKEEAAIPMSLDEIFACWKSMSHAEFQKQFSWFRIFEQLIVSRHDAVMKHAEKVRHLIKTTFGASTQPLLEKINEVLNTYDAPVKPAIAHYSLPPPKTQEVYHLPMIQPKFLEEQWLSSVFPLPIQWKSLDTLNSLVSSTNPTLLYQAVPDQSVNVTAVFQEIVKIAAENNKQFTILHLSDEFARDNIDFYSSPAVSRVIRNYWRPDLKLYGDKVFVLPLGYANNRHSKHYPASPTFKEREHLWSFAGSLDRQGRDAALASIRKTGNYCEKLKPSWSSPAAADAQEYNSLLQNTKFVPCFRGSSSLESYRFYEALEQGAIPIYVSSESHNTEDEYYEVFGRHPFLGFPSWERVAETLPILAVQYEVMEGHRQTIMKWWHDKKEEMRTKLAKY